MAEEVVVKMSAYVLGKLVHELARLADAEEKRNELLERDINDKNEKRDKIVSGVETMMAVTESLAAQEGENEGQGVGIRDQS